MKNITTIRAKIISILEKDYPKGCPGHMAIAYHDNMDFVFYPEREAVTIAHNNMTGILSFLFREGKWMEI